MSAQRKPQQATATATRPHPAMPEPIFVNRKAAAALLSLSASTFMLYVRKGVLPKGLLITPGRVGWRYADLVHYADSRQCADLLPPPNTGNRKGKGKGTQAANDEQAFEAGPAACHG